MKYFTVVQEGVVSKTDAGLVWLFGEEWDDGKRLIHHPDYRALVIRKNADDLSDWIDRAYKMFRISGVKIAYRPPILKFPSGATIKTGHLKDAQAYTKYQGQEYQRMLVEELTQIADEKRYLQLIGSCRSTIDEIKPQIFLTTNPGGIGHGWVKRRFVDPAPPNTTFKDKTSGRKRIYIPARIDDNPTLVEKDPDYIKQLDALKDNDEDLWKAWRMGDWSTFAGQYFRDFTVGHHTIEHAEPESDMIKFGGIDWGYSPRPFVFLAAALEKVKHFDDDNLTEHEFNRLWIYREVEGTEKTPEQWAREIKSSVNIEEFSWIRGDPSMNIKQSDGSRSILDQFREAGLKIIPANNDRINGWNAVRNWFSLAPDGLPYCIISENCHNLITNIPSLIHDEHRVEDLDTDGPDDEADALRYLLIHSKWVDASVGGIKRVSKRKTYARATHVVNPSFFGK
jgi:hypothetical protein